MELAVGAVLALLALAVVVRPFLRPSSVEPEDGAAPDQTQDARSEREALYREMAALEMEHELGQIESQEYEERLQELRLNAAALLQQQEAHEAEAASLDRAVEEQLRAARESHDKAP